jgi:RNA polymerase sigma factor (sigma-70 family)
MDAAASVPTPPPLPAAAGAGTPEADEILMARYAEGNVAAFAILFERHERPVYRYLLRSVAIPALAEELLQEVWTSVVRSARRYEARAQFTTWLYRIARSKLVDHWRARDPVQLDSLDEDDADGAPRVERLAATDDIRPETIVMDRARARAFTLAVEALPVAQREALLLHLEAGLTLAQIAEITGAGVETIKSRLRYACARLRAGLKDWHPEATS